MQRRIDLDHPFETLYNGSVLTPAAPSRASPFVRCRVTWLAYGLLAYMTFMPSALGPLMPYMRDELDLSYTLSALHLSVIALGMILSGLTADRLLASLGRRRLLWAASIGSCIGTLGLTLNRVIFLTLPSALLMGISGSLMVIMIQAILSDVHGDHRVIALMESNVAASLSSLLAPLWASLFLRLGFSWRLALGSGLIALAVIAVFMKGTTVPEGGSTKLKQPARLQKLPGVFWACWIVIVLVVSIEWCMIFWSASYLEKVVGLARIDAVTAVSLFFFAMLAGRIGGSALARRFSAVVILLAALALTLAGFPLFWLGTRPWVNLAGLFITGFGVANLFPLAMSAAIGLAVQQVDQASSRVALASGSAIFGAPLALGWLADQVSIQNAYGVVAPLLLAAIAITWWLRQQL
ncbi:MAG TPA: MFS transporter [Levilinea sp.]|nr:MFS transporter [Levilinea sp.]